MTLAKLAQRAGLPALARWAGIDAEDDPSVHAWEYGDTLLIRTPVESAIRVAVREATRTMTRGETAALARAFVDAQLSMLPLSQRDIALAVWGRMMAWTFAVVAGWQGTGADEIMLDAIPDDEMNRHLRVPAWSDRRYDTSAALAAVLSAQMGEPWKVIGGPITGGFEVVAQGSDPRRFSAIDKTQKAALARLARDPRLARLYHARQIALTGWRPCALCHPGTMPLRYNPRRAPPLSLFAPAARAPLYFASGSNHPGEIKGFAALGQPVGVAANKCGSACMETLFRLGMSGLRVFVDSGAFSEVDFPKHGPPVVVAPISDDEWRTRLGLYRTLALVYADRLYVVAPDRVGDQEETLARMRRYAPEMRVIAGLGANVLVPLQGGAMSLADFHVAAADALGMPAEATIPAIPLKKRATSAESLLTYLATARPTRLHLLGLGRENRAAPAILDAIHRFAPDAEVSQDSVLIRSKVGHTGGKGGGTREHTLALAQVRADLAERAFSEDDDLPGYTDTVSFLDVWATRAELVRIAEVAGFADTERRAFLADPSAFLASPIYEDEPDGPSWYDVPEIAAAVDAGWARYRHRIEGETAKERAVVRTRW